MNDTPRLPQAQTHAHADHQPRAGRLSRLRLTPLRTFLASAAVVAGMAAIAVQAAPSGSGGECGAAASAHHGGKHHGDHGPSARRGGGGEADMMMAPRMSGRLLERIGASAEQREQIRKIMETARGDMKARHAEGKALRDKAMALFTQPDVDAAAVEALRKDMLQRHDQASQRMTQAMLEAAKVLTPEQRAKLAEAMKSRQGKGGHGHQGGQGGHRHDGGQGGHQGHDHHGKPGESTKS